MGSVLQYGWIWVSLSTKRMLQVQTENVTIHSTNDKVMLQLFVIVLLWLLNEDSENQGLQVCCTSFGKYSHFNSSHVLK